MRSAVGLLHSDPMDVCPTFFSPTLELFFLLNNLAKVSSLPCKPFCLKFLQTSTNEEVFKLTLYLSQRLCFSPDFDIDDIPFSITWLPDLFLTIG